MERENGDMVNNKMDDVTFLYQLRRRLTKAKTTILELKSIYADNMPDKIRVEYLSLNESIRSLEENLKNFR